ncbi:hypothetical protein [Yinghuangia seranimata]|uniref:hypothetical protein n=1 Tax=Yinghuangia seranimata TaxID=408067 RepID=UPI00248B4005|nr:hypothetical protein [Yinghuangia seranimata]MDI2129045.1 hypothetical protein [Yinghuangia seranimata]
MVRDLGYFRELPDGEPDGESLHDAVGRQGEYADELAAYLDGGVWLAISTSSAPDVLSGNDRVAGRRGIRTDGTWWWPGELGYYVRTYRVALPAEFAAHARSRGWHAPEVSHERLFELEQWSVVGSAE